MSKARTLADFISDGSEFADGTISVAEVSGAAPLASPTFTGTVTVPTLTSTGNINLGDSDEIRLGDNDDFQLFHDGFHTRLYNNTGDLHIRNLSDDKKVLIQTDNGSGGHTNYFIADGTTGETQLHHLGNQKLSTSSTGVEVTGKTTTDELDLNAIASTISDTAVDVFVYDTSKDSDGGAWRKRTQHTSWYNEAASSTRGSRKEFPAVAVIVAETNQVTIYDGDDPDMPMWIVICNNASFAGSINSVTALNGIVTIGRSNYVGCLTTNFLSEEIIAYHDNDSFYGKWGGSFRGYVSADSAIADGWSGSSDYSIVSRYVNDVAMTVLPNAPIDAATGLPVPTIAVATDGGVSVIKDDGTVVDLTHTVSTNNQSDHVNFTDTGGICYQSRSGSVYFLEYDKLPSADTAATPDTILNPGQTAHSTGLSLSPSGDMKSIVVKGSKRFFGRSEDYDEPNGGLQIIDLHEKSSTANGYNLSVCDILSSYNTGWMNGEIKLATLSDTDDTDVTGTELVTNGTFDSDTSNWEAGNGAILSFDTQRLKLQGGGTNNPKATSAHFTTVVGKTYVASVSVEMGNATTARLRVATSSNSSYGDISNTADGVITKTFTATTTSSEVMLYLYNETSTYAFFDNVSVRLAEEDRSVSGNGLQVFGTVTKNPVATGADLVGYSGFSSSNYLEQPYNSDLDYSGDFVVMGWFKGSGSGSVQTVFHRRTANGADNIGLEIGFNTDNTFYFYTHDGSGPTNTALTGNAVSTGVWTHFACVRNGQRMTTYLNGKEYLTATGTVRDITSSTAVCRIGAYVSSSPVYGWQGDIALIRTSATAPSPEQIKKIYEDEKVLFQENAQATLYGSSDAVTALAYDDDTELLHVGTSAGRSVFQGLQRVDNTTDAVGAAISASNGLVAED